MNRERKIRICSSTAALALLVAFSAPNIRQEPAPQSDVHPVSALVEGKRETTPPTENKALVSEEPLQSAPKARRL